MNARPRLTYAHVISTLALILAMSTGGAYAASLIRTSQIADAAVTTPKLRDGAVKPAKIATDAVGRRKLADGAVGSAEIVNGSVTGGDIRNGSIAAQDLQSLARRPSAFAHVRGDAGETVSVTGSGITAAMLSRPDSGTYCFHDLPFEPKAVSVSGSLNESGPRVATATHGAPPPCPTGTQLMVKLYLVSGSDGTAVDGTFNLVIWP